MAGYKELEVWISARALVLEVYRLTESLPKNEQYGLISQMRRCAVSVPSNIAEGYGRRSSVAYANFLRIAKGSVNELETLILLSTDLGFFKEPEGTLRHVAKVGSMLTNLIRKLQTAVREETAFYDVESQHLETIT